LATEMAASEKVLKENQHVIDALGIVGGPLAHVFVKG